MNDRKVVFDLFGTTVYHYLERPPTYRPGAE